MNVPVSQLQKALSPNPFCLVTSCNAQGKTNVMALSWWTFVSNHPPQVMICIGKKALSGENIQATGQFTLCFPTPALAEGAMACGTCSGRNVDKVATYQLPMVNSQAVKPQRVADCHVVMECQLLSTSDVGDHMMYVGEIVETHLDEAADGHLFSWEGYGRLAPLK